MSKKLSVVGIISLVLIGFGASFSATTAEADKTLKIGVHGPLKYTLGKHSKFGAEMAAEEINTAGGIKVGSETFKMEIITADDNCYGSLPDAVNAVKKLITIHNVDCVIGGYRSEATLAQQEICADYKKLQFVTGSATNKLASRVAENYNRYKYMFKLLGPRPETQVPFFIASSLVPAVKAVKNQLGIDKPKVFIIRDKAVYSEPFAKIVRDLASSIGYEVIGEYTHSFTAKDLSEQAAGLKASGCHIIFRVEYGPSGVPASTAMGEIRIPAIITGGCMEAQRPKHWEDTGGLCNYMISNTYCLRADVSKKTMPFFNKFLSKYGQSASYGGYATYDAIYVYKDAIERAGTLDPDTVVAALEKTAYIGVMGNIAFSPKGFMYPHEMEWGPKMVPFGAVQWQNGKLAPIWPDGEGMPAALLALNQNPGWKVRSGWKGLEFDGTVELQLPPWMLKHYKKK